MANGAVRSKTRIAATYAPWTVRASGLLENSVCKAESDKDVDRDLEDLMIAELWRMVRGGRLRQS